MLMRSIVIYDPMHGEPGRDLDVDLRQEAHMLLAAMALTEDRTGRKVECCKQGGGAMTDVVARHAFHMAQAHGKQVLGAFQGLDLALFIHAQHHRFVRRVPA